MPESKNLAGPYKLLVQRMRGEVRQARGSVVQLGHDEASNLLARGLVTEAPPPEPADTAPTDPPPADAPPAPSGFSSPTIPNKAEKAKK